jgi:predicted transcriptional regulator
MDTQIPSVEQIRAWLAGLDAPQFQALADTAGVPFTTLLKIRRGETKDPRLETVRCLFPHMPKSKA